MNKKATPFPLMYERQDPVPVDKDMRFFTTAERMSYLTNPLRYEGQIISDIEEEKVYVLNAARTAWIAAGTGSGGSAAAELRAGTVLTFDNDAYYGTPTAPESGPITLAGSGHIPGITATIFHRAAIMPQLPIGCKIKNGNYLNNEVNEIVVEFYATTYLKTVILQ